MRRVAFVSLLVLATAPPTSALSLHDALPIFPGARSPDVGQSCALPSSRGRIGKAQLRSEEHTSELQSLRHLVCRLLLEKKNASGVRSSTTVMFGHIEEPW